MIEIGASTANFYPDLTEDALDKLLELGFRALEVFINTESEIESDYIQNMRERVDAAGARILSLHPYTSGNEPFLLYSAYRRRFEDGKKLYARFFKAAAALGARYVVMHGDRLESVLPAEESIGRFEELYDLGRQFGVILAQENVVRFRSSDNAYLRAMRNQLGDKAHFVLDLKQALRSGHTVDTVTEAMGEHIVHVHVSDHDAGRDCLPPGCGETDFRHLIDILNTRRFDGALVVELYRQNFENPQDLVASRRFLESVQNT